jgi:hypothetical protein
VEGLRAPWRSGPDRVAACCMGVAEELRMGDAVIPLPRLDARPVDARWDGAHRVGPAGVGAAAVTSGPDLDVLMALDRRLAAIESLLREL